MKWIVLASLMMVSHLAQTAEVGTTVFTRGEVNATQDDTVRVLARRSPIYQQEHVTTGTDARAVLKLSDDTVVTLGEKASFRLAEYVFNEEEKRALLEIPVGAFRIITGKLTKNENPSFKVSTARSTIAVRGTDFWGGSIHEDAIDIALLDSDHSLIVSNEYGSVEITTPGYGTTVYEGKAPTEPKLWSEAMMEKAVGMISY